MILQSQRPKRSGRRTADDSRHLRAPVPGKRRLAVVARYCAISAFEVALKWKLGKLQLPSEPAVWFRNLERRYELTEYPLDGALCIAAAELPLHHKDPFDRLIIATAQRLAVPVITVDPLFRAYDVEVVG